MRYTQFLIFEICTECNLCKEHKDKCPNLHPDRYKLVDTSQSLTDDKIISIAKKAYNDIGFKGLIGFHYYNEPMVAKVRMVELIKCIKRKIPQARFVLWTNGELIPLDCAELACFDIAFITDYYGKDFERVRKVIPKVALIKAVLDDRLNAKGNPSNVRCRRMFGEFIIDYFGNVHICCIDWRAEVKIGNVWEDSLELLVARWRRIREQISGIIMDKNAPEACRRCTLRESDVCNLDDLIAEDAKRYLT